MVMKGIIVIIESLGTIMKEGGMLAAILAGTSVGAIKKRLTPMKKLLVRSMAATLDLARNQAFLGIRKSGGGREITAEISNTLEKFVDPRRSGGMRPTESIIINLNVKGFSKWES